jgi:hypothetical protein
MTLAAIVFGLLYFFVGRACTGVLGWKSHFAGERRKTNVFDTRIQTIDLSSFLTILFHCLETFKLVEKFVFMHRFGIAYSFLEYRSQFLEYEDGTLRQ